MITDHGLVIGKFHPPHAGHELLIRTAAATARQVSVLVLARPATEAIPLADRVAWLRTITADLDNLTFIGAIDDHPIDYDDPDIWDKHEQSFRAALATATDLPVTAVYSSEPYGPELARRFGATCVPVDPDRTLVPMSATKVRADPVASWDLLPEPVRGGLCRRVVVVGAESTGTSSVARGLADHLRGRGGPHGLTRWVPEVGRAATITKLANAAAEAALRGGRRPTIDDLDWTTDDFVAIAREQDELEDQLACLGGPVLVCDTDAFATGIWHERYRGEASAHVDAFARHHPLYLLTHHEGVPFEPDTIRDGEHLREWMTGRFADALSETGRRFVVLHGSHDERLRRAVAAVDGLLAEGWDFGVEPTG